MKIVKKPEENVALELLQRQVEQQQQMINYLLQIVENAQDTDEEEP